MSATPGPAAIALAALAALGGGCVEARLTIRHQDPTAGVLVVGVDEAPDVDLAPGAVFTVGRPPGPCQIEVLEPATGRRRVVAIWVDGTLDVDIIAVPTPTTTVASP